MVTYGRPSEFTAAETDAREHRRGLWADSNPVPTWEWRREKRREVRLVNHLRLRGRLLDQR